MEDGFLTFGRYLVDCVGGQSVKCSLDVEQAADRPRTICTALKAVKHSFDSWRRNAKDSAFIAGAPLSSRAVKRAVKREQLCDWKRPVGRACKAIENVLLAEWRNIKDGAAPAIGAAPRPAVQRRPVQHAVNFYQIRLRLRTVHPARRSPERVHDVVAIRS